MSDTGDRDALLGPNSAKIVQVLRDANEPVLCQQGLEDEYFGVPRARSLLEELATGAIVTIEPAYDGSKGKRYSCVALV